MTDEELIKIFDKVYAENPGKEINGIKVVDKKTGATLTLTDPRKVNVFDIFGNVWR